MNLQEKDFSDRISSLLGVVASTLPGSDGTRGWNAVSASPLQLIVGFIERTLTIRSGASTMPEHFPLTVYMEGLVSASEVGDGMQFFFEDPELRVDLTRTGNGNWSVTVGKLRR